MLRKQAKVIVNPIAGASSTFRKWPQIRQMLGHIGFSFDYQYTECAGHAIELAYEAASGGYRYLVAVGGDGTINEVANGILNTKNAAETSLGVINTGTGSDFVRSLHIPRSYSQACPILNSDSRMRVDVGVAEYYKNGKKLKRYFINSAGIGFDAEAANATNSFPKFIKGTFPYIMGLLGTLAKYQNKEVKIIVNGKEESKKVLSVVVANGRYFGGGMLVAPKAELSDSLFDVLTVGDMGKFDLLKTFPTIYKGTHIHHPKVHVQKTNQISIESEEKLLVQADGEIIGEGPVKFSMVPSALNVVS